MRVARVAGGGIDMTVKASSTRDSENTEVIKCPSCGKAMWISRKVNGQNVQCPHCARVI